MIDNDRDEIINCQYKMKMGQVCVHKIRQFLSVRNTNLTKFSYFSVTLIDNCCERAATLKGFLWRVDPGKSLQPLLISIRATEIYLFL